MGVRVFHKKKDITNMIGDYVWSGSLNTVARQINFNTIVSSTDYYLPKLNIQNGDFIDLYSKDNLLYRGHVFNKSKSSNSSLMEVNTYDYTIYLAKNKGTYNFKNVSPRQVINTLANDVGIKVGNIANPNIKINRIFENVSIYEIIQTVYTLASRRNGIKYHVNYKGNKLNIVEVGSNKVKFNLSAESNIIESSYSENIDNMVNRVVLYNDEGKRVGVVENKDDINKYGTIQEIYKGKNPEIEAKQMLEGMTRVGSLEALGNINCITGNSILIKEPFTGLIGEFYIVSDTHTFSNSNHIMSLDISFNKIMDEVEAGSVPDENK